MTHRALYVVSGIVLILGGLMALFLPLLASLTAVLIVGWTFVLAGILHIVEAFRNAEDRWWNGGFGLLGVLIGLSFVLNPFGGLLSLTILLGAFFAASGAMQLYLAWKRRATDNVWMLAVSGMLSVGLAVLIAMNLFTAAAIVPGLLLAIELASTGFGLLLLRPDPKKDPVAGTRDETPDAAMARLADPAAPVIDDRAARQGAPADNVAEAPAAASPQST